MRNKKNYSEKKEKINSKKKVICVILLVLSAILLISTNYVSGLGIAPSTKDILYESGKEISIPIKIVNTEKIKGKVVLYAEGEWEKYFTLSEEIIEFDEDDEERIITAVVKMPSDIAEQGPKLTKVIARRVSSSSGELKASVSVASYINILVPYAGKFVKIKLYAASIEFGKDTNFIVEAENLGTEDVISARATIDIYGPMNEKIETLVGDEKRIDIKTKQLFNIPFKSKLKSGSYYAIATLIYDDKNAADKKDFNVGTPSVEIESINVNNFRLGGIAKFEVLLKNNWNMDVTGISGIINIIDDRIGDNGKIMTTSKTESISVKGFEKNFINGYWDTSKVISGKYLMEITLNYLNKQDKKSFDIEVTEDRIIATPTGKVIEAEKQTPGTLDQRVRILTIIVVLVVLFNIAVFFRKWIGKKTKTKKIDYDTQNIHISSPTSKQESENKAVSGVTAQEAETSIEENKTIK